MPKFETKLIERNEMAEGTMAFAFERPNDFNFTAGQFLTVILSNPPINDAKGNRRTFSIASPPQEVERLQITTRMTGSALKRSLAEMTLAHRSNSLAPLVLSRFTKALPCRRFSLPVESASLLFAA